MSSEKETSSEEKKETKETAGTLRAGILSDSDQNSKYERHRESISNASVFSVDDNLSVLVALP
jgi:hypothetical protein